MSKQEQAVPTVSKETIVASLDKWIRQRPGLDFGNYGDWKSYSAEVRSIGKDLQHARALLRYVEGSDSIGAARILYAAENSFSGRLTLAVDGSISYCTGQYWPTEYRRAVCAVLSSCIWDWYRTECLPADVENKGDAIRKWAIREFGRGIGARWFN